MNRPTPSRRPAGLGPEVLPFLAGPPSPELPAPLMLLRCAQWRGRRFFGGQP